MVSANFYPGPSRVYSSITEHFYAAYMEGILSINHRSEAFMDLMSNTKKVLKERQGIPESYEIVFTSSATECWEIIAQSITIEKSFHLYNGDFGRKWHKYAESLTSTGQLMFDLADEIPTGSVDADVVCVTQNETSNATQVSMDRLRQLRGSNSSAILAVDATSSLGGIELDFPLADVWFCSVQKCLGLPAGMGMMVLSPKAVERAEQIGENKHYNSLLRILENAEKNQTSYTPNVLDIYLLNKTQTHSKGINHLSNKILDRYQSYLEFFNQSATFNLLVPNEKVRSHTVLAIETSDPASIQAKAYEKNIILGNGYGDWKSSTYRIANFPAIKSREIDRLMSFLGQFD